MINDGVKKAETHMNALVAKLEPDMDIINALIIKQLTSKSPLTKKLAHHLISSGGKRLRPMIVLASAYLGKINTIQPAYAIAAAVELMHTATLLHDDVVDESQLRRNKSTAHILWGNSAAILVGDFLLGRAFTLMVEAQSLEALKILSDAATVIAEGEVMHLDLQDALDVSENEMMNIIAAKTASLFAAATETGMVLAQANSEQQHAIRDYGYHLGMAFQLMDDALSYQGASEKFGKSVGDDFFEGKMTLPVILCLRQSNLEERAFWRNAIENPSASKPADFRKACALIEKHGALLATHDYALDYIAKAKNALAIFPENSWHLAFEHIADFCVARSF